MGIRCFIAVELPDTVKKEISKLVFSLKTAGADVKWVSESQAHLTLKFLGDTDETAVPLIAGAIEKKMSPYSPFYITISGVGCFPGRRRPRVIWIGIEAAGLISIQRDIDDEMSRFGYEPEKRDFSPHITIGRVRSQRRVPELVMKLDEQGSRLNFEKTLISRIVFMKSELKPAGAEYSTLAEIPLGRRSDVQ